MRSPEKVLNSLSEHSKCSDYRFERLYRVLYNADMFLLAYNNIQSKPGNMTAGSDGNTIDGMSLKRIEKLIGALKTNRTNQIRREERISQRRTGNYVLSEYHLSMIN